MNIAAIYAILVGTGMIGQWTMSYLSHQIPELESEPIRIGFHIAAEVLTALLLIVGGIALFARTAWSKEIFLVSMGMLFYTAIVSPGYFAQQGKWAWLGMFSIIILFGILSVILVW
jgi:hypothetical protein